MQLLPILIAGFIAGISANHASTVCSHRKLGLIEGNVTLGFMFSFFGSGDAMSTICDESVIPNPQNIQLLEAFIFAIKNAEGSIPGITIGLEAYDTCYSRAAAVDHSVTFLRDRLISQGDSNILQGCGEKVKPGLIGSLDDGIGSVLGTLLSNAFVATTGYAADLLSLSNTFGLDYVTRRLPSYIEEIGVMADFMNIVDMNYVYLVSTDSEESTLRANLFLDTAAKTGICVSQHYRLNDSVSVLDEIYRSLFSSTVKTVVVLTEADFFRDFAMKAADHPVSDLQFIVPFELFLSLPVGTIPSNISTVYSAVPDSLDTSQGDDDEFDRYFKSLNQTGHNQEANPWFRHFWESSYDCSFDGSEGSMCHQSDITEHMTSYQRNPFVAPVIDAVDAHIQALKDVLVCDEATCDELPAFTQEKYLARHKQVDFLSQVGNNRRVAFKPSGDPEDTRFQVMALNNIDGQKYLVTEWFNGQFGAFADFPIQASQCEEVCLDPQCFSLRQKEGEAVAYAEGDVILAGFFPVNEWNEEISQCGDLSASGALYVEAMLYAIEAINNDTNLLPGITLGMDGFNTCNFPQRAADITLDLLQRGSFNLSHSATRLSADGTRLEHFFGIVGPRELDVVSDVNSLVSSNKVPMIGYDVDDPSVNTFSYPNFARILPSSISYIHPLFRYMSEQKIFYFQLLYLDDGSPGLRTTLSYFGAGSWTNVCLAQSIKIPQTDSDEEWNEMFKELTKKPDARAVFIHAPSDVILKVLTRMESKTFAEPYLILAGPSWKLTNDDISGLSITRGALILQSPDRTYDNFKEHLKNLRPNQNNTRNPWFTDYWTETFKCNVSSSGSNRCTGQESLLDVHQNDEVIPQVIDATYAMANTLHTLQVRYCPAANQKVCPELLRVDGDTFIETLRDVIDFTSINDERRVTFDYQLGLDYSYNVMNVQEGQLVQIGTLQNFVVTPVADQSFRVYDAEGQEITDDAERVFQCQTESCEKSCRRPDTDIVAESHRDGSGDVWIGGFFELSEPSSDSLLQCSDQLVLENIPLVEAFLFAIDDINLREEILPQLKLSGIAFDSCGSPERVLKEVGNLVTGTVDYRTAYANNQVSISGVIGGATSDTTDTLSSVLTARGINQISYAATATQFSDGSKYPFFLRTVPSDLDQAMVFVDVLSEFGWRYVSVVFSDNIYGNDLTSVFQESMKGSGICVAMTLGIDRSFNESRFDNLVSTLQSNPSSRVVVLFTSDVDTRSVLEAAERQNVTDIQWVGSDTWGSSNFIIANAGRTARGAITVRFRSEPIIPFWNYTTGLSPYSNVRNPWFRRFFQDYKECDLYGQPIVYGVYCGFSDSLPSSAVDNPQVASVINAVYAFAHGLDKALKELCPNVTNHHICRDLENQPQALHEILQSVSFPSAQNPETPFKFDENGDAIGKYDILNLKPKNGSLAYGKIGSWDSGNLTLDMEDTSLAREGMDTSSVCLGKCSECASPEVAFASLDGVIQIAGLAEVHNAGDHVGDCSSLKNSGVLDVEAFLFAINVINADGSILPGLKLGVKIFDSCQSGVRSIKEIASFYGGTGAFLNRTVWQFNVGFIGGATPSVTELSYHVARQYKQPHVSYSFSSNLEDADYLIKTTPTIDSVVQAVLDVLKYFNWSAVSVVADSGDESQMLLYNAFLESSSDLCLDTPSTFTTDSLSQVISTLGDTRVVVMFASARVINSMTKTAQASHKTFVFAGVATADAIQPSEATVGSLVLSFSQRASNFEGFLQDLSPTKASDNPWRQEYLSHKLQCNAGEVTEYSQDCLDSNHLGSIRGEDVVNARRIIDGVFALATSIHSIQQEKCGSGTKGLCPEFLVTDVEDFRLAAVDVSITNENKEQVIFQNGQQLVNITVWNIQSPSGNSPVKIADWDGMLPSLIAMPQFLDEDGNVGMIKSPCPAKTTTTNPTSDQTADAADDEDGNNGMIKSPSPAKRTTTNPTSDQTADAADDEDGNNGMIKSPSPAKRTTTNPTSDQTADPGQKSQKIVSEDYHREPWFILALILSGLGVLFTLLVLGVYVLNSDTNYAQFHSSFLVYTLLVSLLLMFSQTVLFGLEVHPAVCALRRILPGTSFSLAFVCIFLMSGRYFRILKKEQRVSGLGAKYIDNRSQMIAFLCVFPMECIILLQWLLYEPPSVDESPKDGENLLHCKFIDRNFPISFIFIYLLMFGSTAVSTLALRRSRVYFTSELFSTITCCILSVILGVVWVICGGFLKTASYYVTVTGFLGILQGYIILVTILPVIVRGLFKDEAPFDETGFTDASSVADGTDGFTNPVSVYESPYDSPPLSNWKQEKNMQEVAVGGKEDESPM